MWRSYRRSRKSSVKEAQTTRNSRLGNSIGQGTTAQDGSAFDADFCAGRTACAAAAVRVSGLGSRCPKPVQTAMCRFARFPLGRELQNFNNNMTYSGYRTDWGMKVEDRS